MQTAGVIVRRLGLQQKKVPVSLIHYGYAEPKIKPGIPASATRKGSSIMKMYFAHLTKGGYVLVLETSHSEINMTAVFSAEQAIKLMELIKAEMENHNELSQTL